MYVSTGEILFNLDKVRLELRHGAYIHSLVASYKGGFYTLASSPDEKVARAALSKIENSLKTKEVLCELPADQWNEPKDAHDSGESSCQWEDRW